MVRIIIILLFFLSGKFFAQKHLSDTTFYASGKIQYITTILYDKREIIYYSESGIKTRKYTFINNNGDGSGQLITATEPNPQNAISVII